jgi:hypothetical protein
MGKSAKILAIVLIVVLVVFWSIVVYDYVAYGSHLD